MVMAQGKRGSIVDSILSQIIFWVIFLSIVQNIWWKIRGKIEDGIFRMGLREERIEFFKTHKNENGSYVLSRDGERWM
jgi:hypothetical protein